MIEKANMNNPSNPSQYEESLMDYWRVIRHRWLFIFMLVLITTVASAAYSFSERPRYEAQTQIKIEERRQAMDLIASMFRVDSGDFIETEIRTIRSFDTVQKVARVTFDKDKHLLVKSPEGKLTIEEKAAINNLQAQIACERESMTNIVNIKVVDHENQRALDIANNIARVYQEENKRRNQLSANNIKGFADKQAEYYKQKLFEINSRIAREYPDKVQEEETRSVPVGLGGLEGKRQTLLEEYRRLSVELTDEHPQIKQVKAVLADIDQQLQAAKVVATPTDIAVPEMKTVAARESLEQMKQTRSLYNELYQMYMKKLEEMNTNLAVEYSDVIQIEPARLGKVIATNMSRNILLGLLLGVIVGLIFAFVIEAFDTSINTIQEVERVLSLSVLGVIPQHTPSRDSKNVPKEILQNLEPASLPVVLWQNPHSPFVEAYRIMQANLQFASFNKGYQVVLFTSTEHGEGKSLTSTNFALVQARMGKKVLLVDCDFRRPKLHKLLGLTNDIGLSELVVKNDAKAFRSITDMVIGLGVNDMNLVHGLENLQVLTTGCMITNPSLTFSSERMKELIRQFKQSYDVIVLDTTPVLAVSDALILAALSDSVVIVYELGRVSRAALRRVKEQIANSGVEISGIVLNNVKARDIKTRFGYYSYGYYYSQMT